MPTTRSTLKRLFSATALALLLFAPTPAAADWLITLGGHLIETQGGWTVEGKTVHYTDADGAAKSLALAQVDLAASEETTALREGRPYVPSKTASEAPADEPEGTRDEAAEEESKITLYETSWCGYCRKTRRLLNELGAEFVAKDIEKNQEAAREYRAKSGGRGGVPLIDFDGRVVRGYNERAIRQQVREIQAKEAG